MSDHVYLQRGVIVQGCCDGFQGGSGFRIQRIAVKFKMNSIERDSALILDAAGYLIWCHHYQRGLEICFLDYVDMGCTTVTDSSGNLICTQAQQILLIKASLQQAILKSADLKGATLTFANLEGADLTSALLLEPKSGQGAASLSGAYLKNAILEYANLSGVNLSNANFYANFIR